MNTIKKPIRTDRDKEEYFRAEFHCPTCGAFLSSYTYGRAWADNRLDDDKLVDCHACGQMIDWSEELTPKRTTRPSVVDVLTKMANGLYTVNQARDALGLPPVEGGDV